MPSKEIPRELQARHADIVARAMTAIARGETGSAGVVSDPDANLQRVVSIVLAEVEPMVAALTLRAFAVGAERVAVEMPEFARVGALAVISAARDVAEGLDGGMSL